MPDNSHTATLPSPVRDRCQAFITITAAGARRYCRETGPHQTHAVRIGSRKWFWR